MTTRTRPQAQSRPAMLAQLGLPWWMFLVTGVAWLIITVAVLRFNTTSVATIGVLIGLVFLIHWPARSCWPRRGPAGAGCTS
jgi:uncharacterized membrane protein HdeD (DUF308 family)